MRYAIISDIHGNLEAFKAVLDSLSTERIDKYVCGGDIVGYGADPTACVRLLKSLNPIVQIAGNHDWGVLGLTDIGYFNEWAKKAVLWTKDNLEKESFEYLQSFRLVYEDNNFTASHGTLNSPEEFLYMLSAPDAKPTLEMMKTQVCFVGHTHFAGTFYSDEEGDIRFTRQANTKIEKDRRYVINAGSVGQPRDGDPRASCAIYDTDSETAQIKRVEYDIRIAQDKILAAGLPEELAYRLSEGR